MMKLNDLNEALLWLAHHQGTIRFGASVEDRVKKLDPPMPTVEVEVGSEELGEVRTGTVGISAGRAAEALLLAIQATQKGRA